MASGPLSAVMDPNIELFGCSNSFAVWRHDMRCHKSFSAELMLKQATFSFSAAAGVLWVAAFSGLLSPQGARRASLDSLKGSPSAGPPAGDEQYDMAAETLAGANGGPPGADPASVRRKQQQVCSCVTRPQRCTTLYNITTPVQLFCHTSKQSCSDNQLPEPRIPTIFAAMSAALCAAAWREATVIDASYPRCLQAEAFSGDTALRIRPGIAARSSKLTVSPDPVDDIESSTPPGASSGGVAAAFVEGAGSGDGKKSSSLAWKPLQGRAQQVVLLCWMHGAIGYGYFVMQVRARHQTLFGDGGAHICSAPRLAAGPPCTGDEQSQAFHRQPPTPKRAIIVVLGSRTSCTIASKLRCDTSSCFRAGLDPSIPRHPGCWGPQLRRPAQRLALAGALQRLSCLRCGALLAIQTFACSGVSWLKTSASTARAGIRFM